MGAGISDSAVTLFDFVVKMQRRRGFVSKARLARLCQVDYPPASPCPSRKQTVSLDFSLFLAPCRSTGERQSSALFFSVLQSTSYSVSILFCARLPPPSYGSILDGAALDYDENLHGACVARQKNRGN